MRRSVNKFVGAAWVWLVVAVLAMPGCTTARNATVTDAAVLTEEEKFEELLTNCALGLITSEPGIDSAITSVKIMYFYNLEEPTTMTLEVLDTHGVTTPFDLGEDAIVMPGPHMTGVISIAEVEQPIRAFVGVVDPRTGEIYKKEYGLGSGF